MPRDITITLKDGTQHTYKGAPDDVTPDAVTARAEREFGQPVAKLDGGRASQPATPSQEKNPYTDSARTLPGAIAQGVAGLAGLPAELRDLGASGVGWVSEQIAPGSRQKAEEFAKEFAKILSPAFGAPTSSDINKKISELFGGYYEPKTEMGKTVHTIGTFAPAAAMPGSFPARIARTVIPGAGSELAGQMTEGTPYEPYARAGGALVGGALTGGIEGALSRRAAINSAPTPDQLSAAKTAAYKAADAAGVVITPQSFKNFAADLSDDLTKSNVVQPKLHENALAALKVVQDEAAAGTPISLERADAIRQVVNNAIEAGAKNNGGDLRLAQKVKSAFDKYLDALTPADTLSGNASVAVPILKEARALAQRKFKAKEIQKLIDLAENQASSNYSASGVEQALRVQFKNFNAKLIKDEQLAKSFTAAEREAIANVAKGGSVGNALRLLGKLAPTNVISGGMGTTLGAGLGSAIGGPVGAMAGAVTVPAVGAASRAGATAITRRNAELAAALMRSGKAGALPIGSTAERSPLIAALLSQGVNH